ncbi:MAG TPA: type II secretion system inner membrane protein GspF [Desulfuromonadales bacterium]|nr:type II secretion system inner membrane protein GspF [Desulfuromonadales bacterium]
MPLFEYSGLDHQGRKKSGMIDGPGRKAVTVQLRSQGIYPTELRETRTQRSRRLSLKFTGRRKLPPGELAAATRQMATLLGAGLALDDALGTVSEQSDQPLLARTFASVRNEVVQGETLHRALAGQQQIFPDLFINMIQVGEDSGTLDQTMHRLADFLENQARMRSRIQAALAYPLLMTLVGSGVLVFLFVFVVPKITGMLDELEQALPWPTLLLITVTDFLASWWWLLGLLLIGALLALQRYRNSERGRLRTDALILRTPLLGRLQLLVATARFARTLGTLLESGVPLLKALDISRKLLTNRVLNEAVETATRSVKEGGSLAASLKETAVFPPMLAQVAAAGEKSGQLEDMLFRVADTYEHQTDLSITSMLSLLEPLMILVMGGIVGFVVLAILLPIFQASQGF